MATAAQLRLALLALGDRGIDQPAAGHGESRRDRAPRERQGDHSHDQGGLVAQVTPMAQRKASTTCFPSQGRIPSLGHRLVGSVASSTIPIERLASALVQARAGGRRARTEVPVSAHGLHFSWHPPAGFPSQRSIERQGPRLSRP